MKKPIRLDLRAAGVPGGRLSLSMGTTKRAEGERRKVAVRKLVDSGEWTVLQLLRNRRLKIERVVDAVERGDVGSLRPGVGAGMYTLGTQADKLLEVVTPGAFATYRAILTLFRRDFGDELPMESLTRGEALAWLKAPKPSNGNRAWSPGRRELARTVMGRLWAEAIYQAKESARPTGDRPVLEVNPWRDARPSRGTKDEIAPRAAYLTEAQWAKLLEVVRGTERAAFYALCCFAGLRRTEALMLRTGVDVELPPDGRGRIRVQPRGGAYAWKPKTKRSVRDVPMCSELRAILDDHVRLGFAGATYFLHPPKQDRPFNENTPSNYWAPLDFAAAGLPFGRSGALTTHSLRHSFASWLLQRGADLLTVAKLLGDTVAVVERVYGHLRPADLENTVDLLDRRAA